MLRTRQVCNTFWTPFPYLDLDDQLLHADLDTSIEEDGTAQSVSTSLTTHMVRGTWLSRSEGPPTYGLPRPLLSHLRAALNCDYNESIPEADVRICFWFPE